MSLAPVRSRLRELRLQAGLQQRELAEQAGVSRQSLSALEQGESVPATDLALRLARVLGCRVEDIFWLEDEAGQLEATLVTGLPAEEGKAPLPGPRVGIVEIDARWVAQPLDGEGAGGAGVPADGLVEEPGGRGRLGSAARIRRFRGVERLRQNLLIAGCDPALALLAGHLADRFSAARLHWLEIGSGAALEHLGRSEVHGAGVHLFDEESGEHNVAAVRRRLGDRAMVLVNLASWEQGLLVAPGNPRRIRGVGDLARKGVRIIGREKGTGSEQLLARRAADEGVPRKALHLVGVARSHLAVARAVAGGAADVGVATLLAARTLGLKFIPLEEARFDLVLPRPGDDDVRLARLLDVLRGERFRRDLGALAGYGTSRTGQVMVEIPGRAAG